MASDPAADSPTVDVNGLMRQIREKVRPGAAHADTEAAFTSPLSRLRMSASELREVIRRTGQLPPSPPTLRGRLGGVLASLVHRLTAWQIHQNRAFQTAVATVLDEQTRHLEGLSANLRDIAGAVERLEGLLAVERTQARQERERLEGLLKEEGRTREELAADCRSSLHRMEHALLRRPPA